MILGQRKNKLLTKAKKKNGKRTKGKDPPEKSERVDERLLGDG